MSARTMMVVALALVFGGSAAVGVNSLRRQAPVAAKVETVTVYVAAADIMRGLQITRPLLKTREYIKDQAPTGAVTKLEDAENRVVFIPLLKDDPLVEPKLAPKGTKAGLASIVPKGMRAFTIQTPNISSAVAGFVLPGNKVDVL